MRVYNGYEWNFPEVAKEIYRVTKPGGVVVWVVGDTTSKGSESLTSFRHALAFREIGFRVETMIYQKAAVGACGSHEAYNQAFEYMFVLSKGKKKTFNPIKDLVPKRAGKESTYTSGSKSTRKGYTSQTVKKTAPSSSKRTNVWKYSVGFGSGDYRSGHPAVFPEKLAADHIISWSNPGDLVLDPFSGSGTTAAMAKSLGRHFIGFEVSKDYCEVAEKRLAEVTGEVR